MPTTQVGLVVTSFLQHVLYTHMLPDLLPCADAVLQVHFWLHGMA